MNERRPRRSVRRPPGDGYLKAASADQATRMVLELLSELWIARDRAAVLEQLLVEKGVLAPGAIDGYEPQGEFAARLEALRELTVENVLSAPFRHEETVDTLVEKGRRRRRLLADAPGRDAAGDADAAVAAARRA